MYQVYRNKISKGNFSREVHSDKT